MNHNFNFDNVNDALPALMQSLLIKGDEFGSRAGRTLELTHVGITLAQPWQREIVLPDRKANIAAQIVETMWVLSGRNDVAGLSHYLPRAADFSDDGKEWRAGYGPRLRNYHGVDQLAYLVDTMRTNPGSRQAVATIWDPTVDTTPGKDIACNNWLSLSSRQGNLDLMVGIRSNDAMWGWSGINAFEWSALLELVAGLAGLSVGSLHFAVTSFHLYDQHWDKAQRLAKIDGNFRYSDSPRFSRAGCKDLEQFDILASEWFRIERLIRTGQDTFNLVDTFPEPMLRSWLRVLQWYWSGDQEYLSTLRNTRLYEACKVSIKPPGEPQTEDVNTQLKMDMASLPDFFAHVNKLHAEKHAAYGDSWKRRGEYMILANIARKVDRLEGGSATADETQTDTAIDLMVYLAKYRCWLETGTGDPVEVVEVFRNVPVSVPVPTDEIVKHFEKLEAEVNTADRERLAARVDEMLCLAMGLAYDRWSR